MALSRDLYRAFDQSFKHSSTFIGRDVPRDFGHVINIELEIVSSWSHFRSPDEISSRVSNT